MAYRESKLGLMVRLQPDEAAARILAAFRRCRTATAAAKDLEVDRSTLNRWIASLQIRAKVEQVRANQAQSAEVAA